MLGTQYEVFVLLEKTSIFLFFLFTLPRFDYLIERMSHPEPVDRKIFDRIRKMILLWKALVIQ